MCHVQEDAGNRRRACPLGRAESHQYDLRMLSRNVYHYLVDGLTDEKAATMRRSLAIVSGIRSVNISVSRGSVEVDARRDVADAVRIACEVAGARFRTRVRS